MVTAMEVGGRWSEEAYYFLDTLAEARAREAPRALKGSVYQACKRRWSALVSVAGMRSFADTLLERTGTSELHEGALPTLGQLLCEEAHQEATSNTNKTTISNSISWSGGTRGSGSRERIL